MMTNAVESLIEGRQIDSDGLNARQAGIPQAKLAGAACLIDDPGVACKTEIEQRRTHHAQQGGTSRTVDEGLRLGG